MPKPAITPSQWNELSPLGKLTPPFLAYTPQLGLQPAPLWGHTYNDLITLDFLYPARHNRPPLRKKPAS
jgi:hypothetical protein